MKKTLLAFLILSLGFTSCSFEKNIIIGHISGLEKGDVVYLASGDILQTRELIKSITVRSDGEFELKTSFSDSYVTISVGENGKEFNPKSQNDYGFFLEGFSTIELVGAVSDLDYLQISGGLYSLPVMAELNTIRENALSKQKEGFDLFNYILALKKAKKTPKDGENKNYATKSLAELQEMAMRFLKTSSSVFSSQDTIKTKFLLDNPDLAYSAALLLSNYDLKAEISLFEKTFFGFSPRVQNTNAGKLIARQITAIRKTTVGNIAPDFTALDINGNSISLSDFNGKYVLLEFWATWCRSCKRITPEIVSLYGKYEGPNFQIIGVTIEDFRQDNLKNAILQNNRNWIQINDSFAPNDIKIQNLFAVTEVPTCFFIGPTGKIIAKGLPKDVIPIIENTLANL